MNIKMDRSDTIENDKDGFCILKTPTIKDAKDNVFRTFCGTSLNVKTENGNLRLSKNIKYCSCLKCLRDFYEK